MPHDTKTPASPPTPLRPCGSGTVSFTNLTYWFVFPLKYASEYRLAYYNMERAASTNDAAMNIPEPADNEISVVSACEQTAGRGQGGNTWVSEPGKNITASLVCQAAFLKPNEQFKLSQAAALAIRHVLGKICKNATIKWPNDIYVGDKKVSGILIQCVMESDVIQRAVVGVGVNVNQLDFENLPNAVSLAGVTGSELSRDALLESIAARFAFEYEGLRYNCDQMRQRYTRHQYRRKGTFAYRDKNGTFEAEFVRVENDGHLVLRDTAGRERKYAFKEVEFA